VASHSFDTTREVYYTIDNIKTNKMEENKMIEHVELKKYIGKQLEVIEDSEGTLSVRPIGEDWDLIVLPKDLVLETRLIYKFDQLTEEAKKVARKWLRSDDGNFTTVDSDYLTDNFIDDLTECGWKEPDVSWSLNYCQGDGVSFTGEIDCMSAFKLVQDRLYSTYFREIYTLCRRELLFIKSVRIGHHYSHSRTVAIDIEMNESGWAHSNSTFRNEAIDHFMNVLGEWKETKCSEFEKLGYDEIEYRGSDECVDEDIRANEYEFTVDGSRA
jgi:predicted small secreted protein